MHLISAIGLLHILVRIDGAQATSVDKLVDRALQAVSAHADLENATLGKTTVTPATPTLLATPLHAPRLASHKGLQRVRTGAALGRQAWPCSARPRLATHAFAEAEDSRVLNLDFVPRLGWRKTVFPAVVSPVVAAMSASAFAIWLQQTYGFKGIDGQAHQVLGTLVSFLTVFRTQQAYSRYWEGRGDLGKLMAGIVDTASIASVLLGACEGGASAVKKGNDEDTGPARSEIARLLRLYMRETVVFLRDQSRQTQRSSNYWLPEDATSASGAVNGSWASGIAQPRASMATERECELLASSPRPPTLVLQWVRAELYSSIVKTGLGQANPLEGKLITLQQAWNGCAKIATMPYPQPYTQMARWLSFFFILTVPLAFVKSFGSQAPAMVAASALIAFGYYGLDYCSNQLQNPYIAEFGDVQLDGRFLRAVVEDVDMLLLGSTPQQNIADIPKLHLPELQQSAK